MKRNLPTSFNQLIQQSKLPVVVDFWAEWCGPCKMVSPSLERIAKEYSGKLLVVKINVDEKPHIAAQYQIQSIPTIMMFQNGQAVMRLVGAQPYESLKRQIQRALS